MSRENVELIRVAYEHLASTGEPDIGLLHPSVEIEMDPLTPGQRTMFHGSRCLYELIASWDESFEGFNVRPEGFLDAGNQVVVMVEVSGHGATSGVELHEHWAHLWTLRDGKAVRLRLYRNPPEALKAAGLRE
jgi:uncharacterized protein